MPTSHTAVTIVRAVWWGQNLSGHHLQGLAPAGLTSGSSVLAFWWAVTCLRPAWAALNCSGQPLLGPSLSQPSQGPSRGGHGESTLLATA